MKPMTPLETKLLAELTRLQARLDRAENALRALGYEPHGVGWAIQAAEHHPGKTPSFLAADSADSTAAR